MSSATSAVILWCIFMITIQSVYTDTDTTPLVNFRKLNSLITHSKTIIISGKKVNLEEWFSRINGKLDVKNKHVLESFTFIKCECAYYLKTLTRIVSTRLTYCPSNGMNNEKKFSVTRCWRGVDFLFNLREYISSSMTTLFESGNRYRILRSHEQYFLKTLIMAFMYIDSLNDPSHDQFIDQKYIKSLSIDQNRREISKTQFNKMRRVVLQITNLFERFTIEFCDSNVENTGKYMNSRVDWSDRVFKKQASDFHKFLKNVVSFDNDPKNAPIRVEDFKLQKCMDISPSTEQNDDDDDANKERDPHYECLCHSILQQSSIQSQNYIFIMIRELSAKIKHTREVSYIYEFLLAVYSVIWTFIHRETAKLWMTDNPSHVEDCEGIISKLQALGCPNEMVEYFEKVLKVQSYSDEGRLKKSDVQNIGKTLFKPHRFKNVMVPEVDLEKQNISLTDLMNIILGEKFKHYWLLFTLLYKESDKKSKLINDFSLDLTLEYVSSVPSENENENNSEVVCNKLTDIYQNFFIIQSMYKQFLSSKLKSPYFISQSYEKIRSQHETLSKMMADKYNEWYSIDYLRKDKYLRNIIYAATLHLKNELYPKMDRMNNSEMAELIKGKQEKVDRIKDYIMNLLDDYQIRRCAVVKNRFYVYENVYSIYTNDQGQQLKEMFNNVYKNLLTNLKTISARLSYSKTVVSVGYVSENDDSVSSSDDTENLVEEIISIPDLTGQIVIDRFESLAKGIYFNWQGNVKSMHGIRTEISENVLNVYDIAEYQNLFVRWLLDLFYVSWFVYTEHVLSADDTKLNLTDDVEEDDANVDAGIKSILQFHPNTFPPRYKKYADYCQDQIDFFNILFMSDKTNKSVAELVREEILRPITKFLGTVKTNYFHIDVIKRTFDFDDSSEQELSEIFLTVFSFIQQILTMVAYKFVFFERTFQNFKYLLPHQ